MVTLTYMAHLAGATEMDSEILKYFKEHAYMVRSNLSKYAGNLPTIKQFRQMYTEECTTPYLS